MKIHPTHCLFLPGLLVKKNKKKKKCILEYIQRWNNLTLADHWVLGNFLQNVLLQSTSWQGMRALGDFITKLQPGVVVARCASPDFYSVYLQQSSSYHKTSAWLKCIGIRQDIFLFIRYCCRLEFLFIVQLGKNIKVESLDALLFKGTRFFWSKSTYRIGKRKKNLEK